jgi:hypothetical protein
MIFFDTMPRFFDVSGKSLNDIKALTKGIAANGSTSIGCGMGLANEKGLEIDGVAVVSDGGENQPPLFAPQYRRHFGDREVPVYFYRVAGDPPTAFRNGCATAGIDFQEFDLTGKKTDAYGLPNLVQTMRTKKYSLYQEILDVPLLTLDEVFSKRGKGRAA